VEFSTQFITSGQILFFGYRREWMSAFIWSTTPAMTLYTLFMIFSQVNHLVSETQHEATTLKAKTFRERQVLTSHNIIPENSAYSMVNWWVSGGLNLQIEHHLFPGVHHYHLLKLQPIVEGICKKYGVQYITTPSYTAAIVKYIAFLKSLS